MTNYDEHGNVISDAEWYAYMAAWKLEQPDAQMSQFWLNPDYTLNAMTEPPLKVKAIYSDMGTYVQDFTADLLQSLAAKYGGAENLSPALQEHIRTYPTDVNPNYQALKEYAAAATEASNPVLNTVPVAVQQYVATGTAAIQKAAADAQTAIAPVVEWVKQNLIVVVLVVAGIIIVPAMLRGVSQATRTAPTRYRRTVRI